MQINKKSKLINLLKLFFIIVAITSLVVVLYNIGIYTDEQNVEVFAEINQNL